MSQYRKKWNLDAFYQNGSASPALHQALVDLDTEINHFSSRSLSAKISSLQNFDSRCHELENLIACLVSQDVKDTKAVELQAKIVEIRAAYEILSSQVDIELAQLEETSFQQILNDPALNSISFFLQEKRSWAKEKMPLAQEQLVHRLWIDGYQGWNDLYGTWMGQIRISTDKGFLSVSQAENQLAHPDRKIRQSLFSAWEKTWETQEELFAQILNHLSGFRLQLYQARGWDSVLKEPLFYNRMQESTLKSMWKTVSSRKNALVKYFEKKASLLSLPRLAWFDIESPLPSHQSFIPYEEAATIIIEQFSAFSPSMGLFAQKAFDEGWIEAEDRPGKRPGGFCAHFPKSKQSRIFMTYSGTMTNVFTLAHELGHAYHDEVINSLPRFSQHYRMNVAETASTLAEMVVIDSMIEKADRSLKTALLDFKIQRSVIFLMNIHARFLFETRFYEERKKGFILASTLNHLMEHAQKEAFCYSLQTWHPHFWAAKQHFYATGVPFYNFPYTFGYLFSLGLYAHLRQHENRSQIYEALLADTGRMTTEELALHHLNIDLTRPLFWENALTLIEKDIEKLLTIM